MTLIKRIQVNNDNWHLVDEISGATYRELPFENYSMLPYYKHAIKHGDMVFIFSLDRRDAPNYKIGDFSARREKEDEEDEWFRRQDLKVAFDKTLPLLTKFLIHMRQMQSDSSKPTFENQVPKERFWTYQEEQLDRITNHLSSALNVILILLNYDKFTDEQKDSILFFDPYDEEENFSVAGEIKRLGELLTPDAPLKKFQQELYEQYISGQSNLPEEEEYVNKYLNMLRPYFISPE